MCLGKMESPGQMTTATITKPFTYNYTNYDGQPKSLTTSLAILSERKPNELAHRIVAEQMEPMQAMLDAHVDLQHELSATLAAAKQQHLCETDENLLNAARMGAIDIDAIVRATDNRYKDEILEYATKIGPTDADIFAQSFHRLAHSAHLVEILLQEQEYAKSIVEMNRMRDAEVSQLIAEQQDEMEVKVDQLDAGTTSEEINALLSQHYSRQNLVQKQWESELDARIGHQKSEYRNWIVSLLQSLYQTDVPTPVRNCAEMFAPHQPAMEESFTIFLGSQLKHLHNIRLIASSIYEFCSVLHLRDSISGPNIALNLYSASLTAVVVLTPSGRVRANEEIMRNAAMSTEFHFGQIGAQVDDVQSEVNAIDARNNGKLRPGDFFVTRHSNLSQTHVIFHLISDEASNSPEEINSRHPVILGLRNILKTASRHDVTCISIPALLRHEMSEDMTVPWCTRRAELVFKCAKGFMIESATWGGSELSTLQLVLPKDISEELFGVLSGMVPHVFRLANAKVL